ncbi:MAG: TIGR03066 family protein [Planctomycetes bacterium]|nr:TIGR03066 family protein [Planctomycetota bacterium]
MRAILGCALMILGICSCLCADDKKSEPIDAKKLVGKWEPKEKPKDASVTIEFTKDGKVTVAVVADDKGSKFEGTYKVDGNKLTVAMKTSGKEDTQTRTVIKLTDTELVTKDEKGKEREFTRVGDKK